MSYLNDEKSTIILAHDIGTTGNKACLFRVTDKIELLAEAIAEYPLILEPGKAEQNPDDWWEAICSTTRLVLSRANIKPESISALSYCTQMQGFIPVDENGKALRNAMSYMDSRGSSQRKKYLANGLIKVAGINLIKLLKCLRITGVVPASVKDPVWKYLWLKENETGIYQRMAKWYDVKEYLLHRCTGSGRMTYDSAFATLMFDSRKGQYRWPRSLLNMFGVKIEHMPELASSTDKVGSLTENAAVDLGLVPGIPVFGGGGDATLIPIGAGCTQKGDGHIYIGTSGWVSVVVEHRAMDLRNMIASVIGAIPGKFNYFAEQETSGVCLQWVRDHLALDEINVFLKKEHVAEKSEEYSSLYEYLSEVVENTPVGAGGVIFTPWLRGSRCPVEAPESRGMFFNIGLDTGKKMLIRSVLEGVAFHKRWMLEAVESKVDAGNTLRFVGGGANSPVWCQIIADVTGKNIEVVDSPQNAGVTGAALICAVGLGVIDSLESVDQLIKVKAKYSPNTRHKAIYDQQYQVFKTLYKNNKESFVSLNT